MGGGGVDYSDGGKGNGMEYWGRKTGERVLLWVKESLRGFRAGQTMLRNRTGGGGGKAEPCEL